MQKKSIIAIASFTYTFANEKPRSLESFLFSLAPVFEVGLNYRPIEQILRVREVIERRVLETGLDSSRNTSVSANTERKPPWSKKLDGRRSTDFTSRKIPPHKSWAQVANRYGDRLLLLSGRRVITEITALVSGSGNIGTSRGNHFAILLSPFFLFSKAERKRN